MDEIINQTKLTDTPLMIPSKKYVNFNKEVIDTKQMISNRGGVEVNIEKIDGETIKGPNYISGTVLLNDNNPKKAKFAIERIESSKENVGHGTLLLNMMLELMEYLEETANVKFLEITGEISEFDKLFWKHSLPFYQNFVLKKRIFPSSSFSERLKFKLYDQDKKPIGIQEFLANAENGTFTYVIE